jgi:hypothetical protein
MPGAPRRKGSPAELVSPIETAEHRCAANDRLPALKPGHRARANIRSDALQARIHQM